ncbi:hypothetical protein ACN20G_29915 (plasmid) [Streptomyces sp. BI20]|uniref:hypothetical protein n=1 Tax=Streptomyces sp. BI20 TaxID=3403460 RepID=UPI003C778F64
MKVKDQGSWKTVTGFNVKHEGSWKPANAVYQMMAGAWRPIYELIRDPKAIGKPTPRSFGSTSKPDKYTEWSFSELAALEPVALNESNPTHKVESAGLKVLVSGRYDITGQVEIDRPGINYPAGIAVRSQFFKTGTNGQEVGVGQQVQESDGKQLRKSKLITHKNLTLLEGEVIAHKHSCAYSAGPFLTAVGEFTAVKVGEIRLSSNPEPPAQVEGLTATEPRAYSSPRTVGGLRLSWEPAAGAVDYMLGVSTDVDPEISWSLLNDETRVSVARPEPDEEQGESFAQVLYHVKAVTYCAETGEAVTGPASLPIEYEVT